MPNTIVSIGRQVMVDYEKKLWTIASTYYNEILLVQGSGKSRKKKTLYAKLVPSVSKGGDVVRFYEKADVPWHKQDSFSLCDPQTGVPLEWNGDAT